MPIQLIHTHPRTTRNNVLCDKLFGCVAKDPDLRSFPDKINSAQRIIWIPLEMFSRQFSYCLFGQNSRLLFLDARLPIP